MTARNDRVRDWPGIGAVDPVLGHRSRLGVCVLLARAERMTFIRLRELLEETDGGLGAHLKRLEVDGYVLASKERADGKRATWFALTPHGERALRQHITALGRLLGVAEHER